MFMQYIVDMWSAGKRLDRHWAPQYQICNPCHINYDFIGRFENLNNDAKHVLAEITSRGTQMNVTFPSQNVYRDDVPLSQRLKKFYSDVPRDIVQKLIRIYKLDYELFGYNYRWACDEC